MRSMIAGLMRVTPMELTDDVRFAALGAWDSLRQVELAVMVESEYNITMSDSEMDRLGSVRDVRELLASRGITDL